MENFEVRPETPSQYRYFDRWYRIELAFFILFGPALFAIWSVVALYYYHSGYISSMLIRPAVYITAAFLVVRIVYRSFRSAAGGKTIVIDGDRISKRNSGSINSFDRSGITRVRPLIPLTKRWVVLESSASKESFQLPVYVRNGHKMVDRIFRGLEAKGKNFDGAAALRERLYNGARRYNIQQKLRDRYVPHLFRASAATALLSAATALIYWERGVIMALCVGLVNMILQVQAYFAAETFHVEKLLKTGTRPDSDTSFTGYYVMAGIVALLAGMIVGILMTMPVLEYDFF